MITGYLTRDFPGTERDSGEHTTASSGVGSVDAQASSRRGLAGSFTPNRHDRCVRCGAKAVKCPSATIGVTLFVCQNTQCGYIKRAGVPEAAHSTFGLIQRDYQGLADVYA